MKNVIIITTINEPTEAVEKFSKLPDFKLVVVGDKKTPRHWHCGNTVFLAVDSPETAEFSLSSALPHNHYCRKMLGYLHAIKLGADTIVDTDDDNIPKGDWAFPAFDGHFDHVSGELGFINIYKHFTDKHIWPRGLPLRLINDTRNLDKVTRRQKAQVGVWQGLADEDPDVDAIYRLTSDAPCHFNGRDPIVLGEGTMTPFNSQNTMVRKDLFPLLYLPAFVTFRFTDILRSLVSQPIMWLYGYRLGFTHATVVQKRNPHDYFNDFLSEIPMYQHGDKVIDLVRTSISAKESIATNLRLAYASLRRNGIVPDEELKALECWLHDIGDLDA
ncbi:MAG: STELLO glycosyltransferase family protein [Sulfuricaulis sp.]